MFAIGTSVGSFLNVVSDRLPNGKSLIMPRSSCDSCGRQLTNTDLIPVLSYIWLRGHCRHCRASIPLRVFLTELLTGFLFLAVYIRFGLSTQFVIIAAAVSLLIAIAVIDIEHRVILNRMLLPGALVLLALAPFWNAMGIERNFFSLTGIYASVLNSLISGAGAFTVFLGIALIFPGGMGGGDVKLAGLLGLLLGFPGILFGLWGAIVVGGILALALVAARKKSRKDVIPFGPFMSAGAIVILLAGPEIITGYRHLLGF